MAIEGMSQEKLDEVLGKYLTPSHWIDTAERLLGREKYLRQISRAMSTPGRHIFVYGDRGVGKTSLAVTAAALHNNAADDFIYVPCGETTSFSDLMLAVANALTPMKERLAKSKKSGGLQIGALGVSLGGQYSTERTASPITVRNITDALDVIRLVGAKSKGRRIIVIDELDRLRSPEDKTLVAELIKNASTLPEDVRLVFCGIGRDIEELLGAHASVGRYLEPIELERLPADALWDIIGVAAEKIGVTVERETTVRIGTISDGFPHFVHLVGLCMFHAMSDDAAVVEKCDRRHYEAGIKGALERAEHWLRLAYQKATEKTKNKVEYEEALWALADKAETRRQMSDIYERSYRRIMQGRNGKLLPQETFNQRLLTLRSDRHGSIVIGHGAGWYSFRENVLRGYVRLKAEHEGVNLTPEPA